MATMEALVADGQGGGHVERVANPPVRDTFVKIKVHAIALNPTDYKHVFHYAKGGEIIGCDVAGEVVDIGSAVATKVIIGDRIAGLVHGCNSYSPRDGGFAEYAEIKDGIFAHLPDSWSWAEGASLGAGVTTASQGVFQSLDLPWPDSPAKTSIPLLIYGGSTATGCLAIQLAALAGLQVIVLASPKQFDRLQKLGANVCYDYHEPEVGQTIRRDTNDQLMHAFDIITSTDSMAICAEALSDKGKPKVTLLLPGKVFPRDDVDVYLTSGYSVIGETSIKYGRVVAGEPADYEFGKRFWALTSRLMEEGRLFSHDIERREGGLMCVLQGLRDLEAGSVKGHKLVYEL